MYTKKLKSYELITRYTDTTVAGHAVPELEMLKCLTMTTLAKATRRILSTVLWSASRGGFSE